MIIETKKIECTKNERGLLDCDTDDGKIENVDGFLQDFVEGENMPRLKSVYLNEMGEEFNIHFEKKSACNVMDGPGKTKMFDCTSPYTIEY